MVYILSYIGPGGGMALLGPLLAVILSIVGAIAMIAVWPIRKFMKRLHSKNEVQEAS